MAINLGNVNISLRQFQEISSGTYNAGEVKLTSETGIGKVNNHVTMKFLNNTKISHTEVLAIKNAFVKALKSGGVGNDELNRIRQELGLSPMKPVDKTLHERSIKPLSRQQIREILDRNANTINGHEGEGTIRTSGVGFLFSAQGQTQVDDTASYEETTLDITIPAGNLSTLADQDWSTFDEGAFNAAGKDSDAQLKAIPQQFRLEATVNASYNLHFDAPAA